MKHLQVVVALAAGALLLLPAAALAHTAIKARSPGSGSAVSRELRAVRVTFGARIPDGTLTVATAGGTKISRGEGRLVHGDRRLHARLRSGLSAGRYRATVRWLSNDGHVQTSSWSFRLR